MENKNCICGYCGKNFIPKIGQWAKYCSKDCTTKQWHKEHPGYKRKWQQDNKDKAAAYVRKRNEINPDAVNNSKKKCWAKKRALVDYAKEYYGCQNKKCVTHGNNIPLYALDFHHVKDTKKFIVSDFAQHRFDEIVDEINKCVILCAICHRMMHNDDLDFQDVTGCSLDETGKVSVN